MKKREDRVNSHRICKAVTSGLCRQNMDTKSFFMPRIQVFDIRHICHQRGMIIGLLGRSRVGKDTVAAFIISKVPSFKLIRLSTPLKQAACSLYGFTPEQVEGPSKEHIDERYMMTPREAIQSLCNFMMAKHGHDFFSKRCFSMVGTSNNYIMPDVRYAHDIEEVHKRNGLIIKITRPGKPLHAWEDGIDHMTGDFEIANDGSLQSLHEKLDKVLTHILCKTCKSQRCSCVRSPPCLRGEDRATWQ